MLLHSKSHCYSCFITGRNCWHDKDDSRWIVARSDNQRKMEKKNLSSMKNSFPSVGCSSFHLLLFEVQHSRQTQTQLVQTPGVYSGLKIAWTGILLVQASIMSNLSALLWPATCTLPYYNFQSIGYLLSSVFYWNPSVNSIKSQLKRLESGVHFCEILCWKGWDNWKWVFQFVISLLSWVQQIWVAQTCCFLWNFGMNNLSASLTRTIYYWT